MNLPQLNRPATSPTESDALQAISLPTVGSNEVETRKNFLGVFIGTNRTGKSSIAKMYAEKWRQYNDGQILAFDPQHKFKDIATDFLYFGQPDIAEVVCNLRNALFVVDDYKLLHQKNTPESWLIELMNFRAQWNVDIIMVTHSPALVLQYLTYFVTHYYIFRTQTQKDSFAKKIPNYELCLKASQYINTYAKLYPQAVYPKFPHIIVKGDSDDLTMQNIEPAKFNEVLKILQQQYNATRR